MTHMAWDGRLVGFGRRKCVEDPRKMTSIYVEAGFWNPAVTQESKQNPTTLW